MSSKVGSSEWLGACLSSTAMAAKRRHGVAHGEDLRLVVGVVGEGGGEVGSGADEVHGVFQIHVVVVARHRVHHAADFQHGHIGDGKLGPGGELQGDNVAGFHALGDKPCGHTPGFVVNLPVGEAASRVVADVLAVGVRDGCALPDVGDGVVRPIPLGVPTLLQRLVDLQVVDHVSPFCFSDRPLSVPRRPRTLWLPSYKRWCRNGHSKKEGIHRNALLISCQLDRAGCPRPCEPRARR